MSNGDRRADSFRNHYLRVAALMDETEEDVLAYVTFPQEHWRQIWSTNPLERLNREVKRRSEVVWIFPWRSSDPPVSRSYLIRTAR